nr:bifunctional riboflavin kinase/FAD synthetase [Anaerolineae bacterium]
MRHVSSIAEARLDKRSVVTVGVFDGVHRGHQHLISGLLNHARAEGLVPVVLTFYPYPTMVLSGFNPGYYLTLPEKKAVLLRQLGVELLITHPFDTKIRQIRAVDFVDQLIQHLKLGALWVGEDFALGYNREGNVSFLREQGLKKGFDLKVVDLMDAGNERISSSRIRVALENGVVAEAARLLGRFHEVEGQVIQGQQRGRIIGFPTANIDVPVELALPSKGVYAAYVKVNGVSYQAVANIGVRPTFDGETGGVTVEAHILDFSGNIYGEMLPICFVTRLREERKFDDIASLVRQIGTDISHARQVLAEHDSIEG